MSLTSEQNELIVDYFFQCAELKQIAHGYELIVSNLEAAKLYNVLKLVYHCWIILRSKSVPVD